MLQGNTRSRLHRAVPVASTSTKPALSASNTAAFSERAAAKASAGETILKFSRGQTIFAEGDRALHVYKVIEGAVKVSRILSDGHRQILDFHLPGSTFGLEFSDRYSSTAEAIGEVAVTRSRPALIGEGARPEQADEMIRLLSRALSASYEHVAMLGHQGAKERVASFLLQLAQKQAAEGKQAVSVPISRQDMADYLGLTIETTCRTLSTLKAFRVISTPDRGQFVIHNMERLEAIAGGEPF